MREAEKGGRMRYNTDNRLPGCYPFYGRKGATYESAARRVPERG